MPKEKHHFYGKPILEEREAEYVKKVLNKYRHEKADEELKKKIWDDLQHEKYEGRLSIPFKVVLRRDEYGRYPDMVEVILDTKL